MPLNAKQVEQLLRSVHPRRVQRDRKGMSHLAAYDVSAHLTRIFGFGGWEKHIRSLTLVCEDGIEKSGRTGWNVTYKCEMTLTVKDPSGTVIWSGDDAATGSASNLPSKGDSHDFAVKNAVSYALKRCAKDLGDQFGLSLYNKGSMQPLIIRVLSADDGGEADVEKDIPGELHADTDDMAQADVPAEQAPAAPARPSNGSARPAPAGNGRITRPAPAQVKAPDGAVTDIDWMGHLVNDLIPAATLRRELTGFWSNVAEHVKAGTCIDEHAKQIQAMITERAAELGFEKAATAA